MHHHIILALYERPEAAEAAAQDLATGGIPAGALHRSEEGGQSAWDWLRSYNIPGETVERLRQGADDAAALVVRTADADLTRVLAILDRNHALSIDDLGSDLGGTEAGLHPPNAAV